MIRDCLVHKGSSSIEFYPHCLTLSKVVIIRLICFLYHLSTIIIFPFSLSLSQNLLLSPVNLSISLPPPFSRTFPLSNILSCSPIFFEVLFSLLFITSLKFPKRTFTQNPHISALFFTHTRINRAPP